MDETYYILTQTHASAQARGGSHRRAVSGYYTPEPGENMRQFRQRVRESLLAILFKDSEYTQDFAGEDEDTIAGEFFARSGPTLGGQR